MTFLGDVGSVKGKSAFLESTKLAREERAFEKIREEAIIIIQSTVRGWLTRKKFVKQILDKFDATMALCNKKDKSHLPPALQVYGSICHFLIIFKRSRDEERLEKMCRYLISSLESESTKVSYIGIALNKEYSLLWIEHVKKVLWLCCEHLDTLRPESPVDSLYIVLMLHTLVSFTSTHTWQILNGKFGDTVGQAMNQVCANIMGYLVGKGFYGTLKHCLVKGVARIKIVIKPTALSALITLALRPLIAALFSDKLMTSFVIHILSVPALVRHIQTLTPDLIGTLKTHDIFNRSLSLLHVEQNTRIIFNALEGSYALCLLANIVHLMSIAVEENVTDSCISQFVFVASRFLESCQRYVVSKQSNLTHWHPILGWFAQKMDPALHSAIPNIKCQLVLLWGAPIVKKLLSQPLKKTIEESRKSNPATLPSDRNIATNWLRKSLDAANHANLTKYRKLGSPECTQIALTCTMYQAALHTLMQLKLDILTGLCYQGEVLYPLWQFINSFGPNCGLKAFIDHLAANSKGTAPEFQMLLLFCDCMTHYITILDDLEMYEQQEPFLLSDLITLSTFLNQFVFKSIWSGLFDAKSINSSLLFQSVHTLLMLLYRRDSRRSYTPDNHWLLKDVRVSSFISDLEKGKKTAQLLLLVVPHIIPHEERVLLFRRHVLNEKTVMGLTESACASPQSTLITIHRSRIVEDGYQQLALLPPQALKGVIRVRFINEQGLDEAGIDQDGVFKEFLEETIKRVFNPSLNLFRVTSENRLYPSPLSHIQDSHLELFEFVGRMLGKAVYEGIVVEVPFANFFLSQLLGVQQNSLYSSIDELPSLDPELYKSLTYIKHYEGDIQVLDLTFSVDEDRLGQIVTHELIPGGRTLAVTNTNKISYIHHMAHFHMVTQIKSQTASFIRGFRSIINPDWLSLFSTPELQRLISGDNSPLDLKDLRRHTQYYGGFHDSHRVIRWLWDVLEKDFSDEEKRLFLKFVTSCSKPPLLGFAHLEPPFSIRCVEVGDDEDTGDTIGSVIRGFFTIHKKDPVHHLPTSSTCFNVLKLPNYRKKSNLRDKLRYAITSNTGFELS